MRFTLAGAAPDLGQALERWIKQILSFPLRLWRVPTADLPDAAEYEGGLVWDETVDRLTYSDGAAWKSLQAYDATLAALAAYNTNGLLTQTAADTFTGRTIIGPAAGISVTNGSGVAGNPTLALSNDLAAIEALSGTNTIYYRSAADTWTAVSIGGNLGFSGGTLGSSLGTAATKAVGTSGDTVPVANGSAVTWAAGATFGGNVTITGTISTAAASNQGATKLETPGDTGTAGYLGIYINQSTRVGYVGYTSSNRLTLTTEGTYTGWVANGTMEASSFYVGGTKVVGAQGAAVANATDAASAITQLNALLARCRAHGLIAT